MKATEQSVYADDESDSERGYMLRKGSRSVDVVDKSWSWQCQAAAYAFVVLLLALNLMSSGGGGADNSTASCFEAPKHRKIVAIGGGQAADKPWIRDTIIAMTGKDTPRVLYIGTPGFDVLSGYQRQAGGFQKLGFPTSMLNLTDLTKVPSAEERSTSIGNADIIVVSGGNTLFAVTRWRRLGVDQLLRKAMERGAVLCGGSAGAIIWFDGGHSDSLDPETVQLTRLEKSVHVSLPPEAAATPASIEALPAPERALYRKEWEFCRVKGLGFLPFFMCPHHDRSQSNGQARADSFDAMLKLNGAEVGLGIDNDAAIVVDGDRWKIVSDGGTATKKTFLNGEIHAEMLPPNGDWQHISVLQELPDFIALPPSPFGGKGIVGSGLTRAQHEIIRKFDTLPPLYEQAIERALWIEQREQQVLPGLMAEAGVEFWTMPIKEYDEDIVWRSIAPANQVNARRRTVVIYRLLSGGTAVERRDFVASPSLSPPDFYFDGVWPAVAEYLSSGPGLIALNIDRDINFADGLHVGEYEALTAGVGSEIAERFVRRPEIPVYFLDIRPPTLLPRYSDAMDIVWSVIDMAFSSAVVTPGHTTCDDVGWWMWEAVRAAGYTCDFMPDVGVQRSGAGEMTLSGATVIEEGDFLWCDFGIIAMGLWTDTQHVGYVLRDGETQPPAGLTAGVRKSNRMQDLMLQEMIPGRTGNEVLASVVAAMDSENIEGTIYTHPIGDVMHAAGPNIGLADQNNGPLAASGNFELRAESWFSIELSAYHEVPEWEGQRVSFRQEEDAVVREVSMGGNGWVHRDGRQEATQMHLVR